MMMPMIQASGDLKITINANNAQEIIPRRGIICEYSLSSIFSLRAEKLPMP